MKKIITFLTSLFLMLNTYSQEECVEFHKAWHLGTGTRLLNFDAAVIDGLGNIYMLGNYYSGSATIGNINLPAPPSPWEGAFIAKMDTLGNAIWVTYVIGQGAGNIHLNKLLLDNSGNTYIVGGYNGTVNFQGNILNSSIMAATTNRRDGFFAKLDALGQVQWIEVHPGAYHFHIVADQNKNNFYIASSLYEDVPAILNNDTFYSFGVSDILLTKINTQGQVQYVRQAGGKSVEEIHSLSIDDNDNIYISGRFEDTAYFGTYTLISAFNNGREDMFIAKMNAQGTFEWATQSDRLNNVSRVGSAYHSLTPHGNIYVYGRYQGSVDFGGNVLTASKPFTHYLTVLDFQGQFLYTEEILMGDSLRNIFQGAVDEQNNLYLAGFFEGTSVFGNSTLTAENVDFFVSKIQPEMGGSKYLWTVQSSGQGNEYIFSSQIILQSNELYVSGIYKEGDAIFGEQNLPAPSSGYEHGYIAKISDCESSNISTPQPLSLISIYPHPAQAQLNITNLPANSKVSISDITGKVIYQQETMHRTIHIPTQHWSSGMYIVSVSHNGIVTHKKVAIK